MNSPRNLKDDALFLGAVVAVLAGIALLFETTGFMQPPSWVGPIVIMAVGGVLLYVTLVRGRSAIFFGSGTFLSLAGIVLLVSAWGPGLARTWPFLMTGAGLAWLAFGLWRSRRPRLSYLVPSITIVLLSLFFSLFSLRIVAMRLSQFIKVWWPLVLILGGIALFVAWSLSARHGKSRRRANRP